MSVHLLECVHVSMDRAKKNQHVSNVPVMSTVTSGPPVDGAFNSTGTSKTHEPTQEISTTISTMRPHAMITSSDTETSNKVVDDGPDQCLFSQFSSEDTVQCNERSNAEQDGLRPIDEFCPIFACNGLIKERRHLCLWKRRLHGLRLCACSRC